MHPTKLRFIRQSDFRGEDFIEINQSEKRIVCGSHVCSVPIRLQTWLPQAILVSDWLIF
jgi:hypothetical protein